MANRDNDQMVIVRIIDTMPAAATTTKKVSLPAGCYRIAINVKSNLGASNSTVAVAPFVDEAQTQATPGFGIVDEDATLNLVLPLSSGAAGKSGRCAPGVAGTPVPMGDPVVMVANGLQVTITKGGSSTDDPCQVDLLISMVSTHAPLAPCVVS